MEHEEIRGKGDEGGQPELDEIHLEVLELAVRERKPRGVGEHVDEAPPVAAAPREDTLEARARVRKKRQVVSHQGHQELFDAETLPPPPTRAPSQPTLRAPGPQAAQRPRGQRSGPPEKGEKAARLTASAGEAAADLIGLFYAKHPPEVTVEVHAAFPGRRFERPVGQRV